MYREKLPFNTEHTFTEHYSHHELSAFTRRDPTSGEKAKVGCGSHPVHGQQKGTLLRACEETVH